MSYQIARTVGKVLEDIYVVKTRRLPEGTIMRDILVNGTDVNLDTVWKTDVRAGRNVALISGIFLTLSAWAVLAASQIDMDGSVVPFFGIGNIFITNMMKSFRRKFYDFTEIRRINSL